MKLLWDRHLKINVSQLPFPSSQYCLHQFHTRAQIEVLTPNRTLFRKNEIPDSLNLRFGTSNRDFVARIGSGEYQAKGIRSFNSKLLRWNSFIFSPRFHPAPVTNDLHSSTSNTHFCHCFIIITMNNVSKKSNALLSVNSSTSSENDTLQATQEDSKEEDAINNDELPEENETKLSEYNAKNYFNSMMGGKDVWVLFAMAIRCNTRNFPSDKDPPVSKSKVYHTEIKPDAATLKLEITRRWKAYHFSGRQPRPANWKIQKCNQFLMANPIPSSEEVDLDWLASELDEWNGIQQMTNQSQQREDNRVIHRSWSTDVPFLRLYHTLVDDSLRAAFGKAYAAKTREELDGRNSSLFQTFYEKASNHFNDPNWIPHSLILPDLHEDYTTSRPLPLNVAPLTPKEFQKN